VETFDEPSPSAEDGLRPVSVGVVCGFYVHVDLPLARTFYKTQSHLRTRSVNMLSLLHRSSS